LCATTHLPTPTFTIPAPHPPPTTSETPTQHSILLTKLPSPYQTPNYDTPFHASLSHLATSTTNPTTSASGILSTTLFLFTPSPTLLNNLGTLHGGATATLFDLTTSIAVGAVAAPGRFQYLGVTRTLNVTYLAGIREGMRCVVGCEVVGLGARLAVVRGWVREVDGDEGWVREVRGGGGGKGRIGVEEVLQRCKGRLLAVCEHGKVNTDPKERSVKL